MTGFDIAVLVIAGIFVIIGIWKGFLRTVLKFGASILAIFLARLFGTTVGNTLFPQIIKGDSALGSRLSSGTLDNINASIAGTIGTAILFVVLFILFRLIASIVSKAVLKALNSGPLDRILGALLGLVLAAGVVYALALAVDIVAVVITFIDPSNEIYDIVNSSLIFKYFF